jgi:hypothetical protein
MRLKEQKVISEVEMYRASDRPMELTMNIKGFSLEREGGKILGD